MTVRILHGDCRDVLKTLADNSVDSIVTDPPYGLTQGKKGGSGVASVNLESPYGRARIGTGNGAGGFMGMKWDSDVPPVEVWVECLRVLKPGGYLLAFAGTRTQHRMACRIEDAGFEIRDMIAWVYGSGFPKSHNGEWGGTALKPSLEPITMARKPLIGTVVENWREHGTGALNIDGCRVQYAGTEDAAAAAAAEIRSRQTERNVEGWGMRAQELDRDAYLQGAAGLGRWPANLIHDGSEEVLAAFPDAPGQIADASSSSSRKTQSTYGAMKRGNAAGAQLARGDSGSAARFFKECAWQDHDQQRSDAPTAAPSSSLRNELAASVASAVAIWPSLAGILSADWTAPSTSVTASESRALCEAAITATASIGSGFSPESRHERRTPCDSLVSVAVKRAPTGTTTITASLLRSAGYAEAVTFNITPTPLDRGEAAFAKRFEYCAKASKEDRNEGLEGLEGLEGRVTDDGRQVPSDNAYQRGKTQRKNHHPTVKPTDLMRYLCRLVTPGGGVVLDPFMGSGSTLKAAELEGFSAIGIELEADYVEIARQRVAADAPLFANVETQRVSETEPGEAAR